MSSALLSPPPPPAVTDWPPNIENVGEFSLDICTHFFLHLFLLKQHKSCDLCGVICYLTYNAHIIEYWLHVHGYVTEFER